MGGMKWKLLSHAPLFATLWTIRGPWNCLWNCPDRILEWIAFAFSRGSSQPKAWTQVFTLQADSLAVEPPWKPKNTGVGKLISSPTDLPDPGMELGSSVLQVDSYQLRYEGSPLWMRKCPSLRQNTSEQIRNGSKKKPSTEIVETASQINANLL